MRETSAIKVGYAHGNARKTSAMDTRHTYGEPLPCTKNTILTSVDKKN
ncbi:hypothetical protein HMPREF1861_01490 [Corynebacterium kroppenstedtii]|nr:hypothetical protein HMPREF1861_01490 [Corynebacterium kroppenstedtii]